MQITIKLEDSDSCKGCPLVHIDYEYYEDCGWTECYLKYDYDRQALKRPTKYIEENGQ